MKPEELAGSLCQEFDALASERGTFDSHCTDVAEKVAPQYRYEFSGGGGQMPYQRGDERRQFIFDSTAAIALGRYASIMDSLLTPRSQQWHRLTASNPEVAKDREARLWFDEVTQILFKYRYAPNANFSSQNYQVFELNGAFGNGPMFVDELDDAPGIRYKACSLGSVYFKENHQGIIDTFFRFFSWTARQAYQAWGDLCPEKVIEHAKEGGQKAQKEFQFIHVVKPRTDIDLNRKDFKSMKFASYYVCRCQKAFIKEGGYRSFPMPVSRHKTAPGEVYARSPAMEVLPSIRTLQEQKKTLLKQGHRTVDPVLLMHDHDVAGRFSLRPGAKNAGGVTRDGRPLVHTLPVGRVDVGMEMMELERQDIRDVFMVTLFQILIETPRATATEVLERVKEKGILMAPTFARQESEYLGPMIEREIDLLAQQRLLPAMPGVLQEAQGEYTIVYDSPFTRTQRAEEAAGFMRVLETSLQIAAQTGDPSVIDQFNLDVAIPEVAYAQGVPERWMRSEVEKQQLKAQRAAAAARQEAMQAAPGAAALANAGVKAAEKAPEALAQLEAG